MSRLVILSPTQLKLDGLYSNPVRWRHDVSMIGSPSISIIFIHQLFPHLVWSLHEDPDRQPRIINLRWANAEASKDGADCVCVCARVCWFGFTHTETSSSLGTLTEPLTPLARRAAEPSGWDIHSERRRREAHLPSSTGPVRMRWDGAAFCLMPLPVGTPNNSECARRDFPLEDVVGNASAKSQRRDE